MPDKLTQITDFTQLFVNNTPLIDTRAPIEFNQGAFPCARSLPLMSDDERRSVGTCYKQQGQESAIALGHKLVSGETKDARLNAWLEFIKKNPNGALYCFRGGLRSQITQRWIYEHSGIDYPRVEGGYKALRRFLIDETCRIIGQINPIIIGGRTGCGKTLLLEKLTSSIDLEALANHRGSAFGNTTTNQPTQINFENALAIDLIKKQNFSHLLFEDEGANIGTVHIPSCVQDKTTQSDLILLTADIEKRLQVSLDAYVVTMKRGFVEQDLECGFDNFSNYWLNSLDKIKKRLGLERYKHLKNQLNLALIAYQSNDSTEGFIPVIEDLLVNYYDPMYDYQIKKKENRIIFEGDANEVMHYLNEKGIN